MIDPDVQALEEQDLGDLLGQLAGSMKAEGVDRIRELLDHGETGEALRILLWAHRDNALHLTVDQRSRTRQVF